MAVFVARQLGATTGAGLSDELMFRFMRRPSRSGGLLPHGRSQAMLSQSNRCAITSCARRGADPPHAEALFVGHTDFLAAFRHRQARPTLAELGFTTIARSRPRCQDGDPFWPIFRV